MSTASSSGDATPNATQEELQYERRPPTPTSPDALEGADARASRKREREVSIEPATPKDMDDIDGEDSVPLNDVKDRRTPVTKKNRRQLDSTAEEDETPPSSPEKPTSPEIISASPPHESKVRQIREKVRGLNWDDKDRTLTMQDLSRTKSRSSSDNDDVKGDELLVGSPQTSATFQSSRPPVPESDSDDQDKKLKRKLGDRLVSAGVEDMSSGAGAESTKRARDDIEQDVNPREKKRPTPPPDERTSTQHSTPSELTVTPADAPKLAEPQPKLGGFLSYASTSSPFSKANGPPIFGGKPSPSTSLSPFANTNHSNSSISSSTPSSSSASSSLPSTSSWKETSTMGTKRTGFEAFASAASPFASPLRAKSPTASSFRGGPSVGLHRSKSPPRRALGAPNAFSSYAGSASPFIVPPVKKQRQDQGSESETGDGEKESAFGQQRGILNGGSADASEDESERPASFGERLRATKNEDESGNAGSEEEDSRVAVTEQEVQTGEEDDDTLFQVRAKLYTLSNQKQWKERGTGLLKLNVRKSDCGGARLLMRKEAVFTLLLNATLFKGMKCSLAQDPRYVRFSIIEDGTTVHYNLRLANAKVAAELLEEINANIPGDEDLDSSV